MSRSISRVCLVDATAPLAAAFEAAGCSVLCLRTQGEPFFDLPAALAAQGFAPDMVLQVERLARRSFLTGLDRLDCPLLFWALDPHLNAHWQDAYGRLFDVVCSTQRAWIPALAARGAAEVRWLPWFGLSRPEADWAGRRHGLAFVGRVTPQRPARRWLVEFLESRAAGHDPVIRGDMSAEEMLDLYARSRIVPNESIFGEVNFRLFEAASCGCLVLGQAIEEQADLFEPGREIDTYDHVAELGEKIDLFLRNDRLTRTMGRAARARVLAEHLPGHRAAALLALAGQAGRNRATGSEADKWSAVALAAMWEAGRHPLSPGAILGRLARAGQDPDVLTATLRVQAACGMTGVLAENVRALLAAPAGAPLDLSLTASSAALRVGDFAAAKVFFYRWLGSRGAETAPPADGKALLVMWARELEREGRVVRPGFVFEAGTHLPATALDCLLNVLADEPEDLPTLRLLDAMTRSIRGMEQIRVGYLSILTLFERDDWRLALEIALADLRSNRLESGLEELRLARGMARAQGRERDFLRALGGRDRSGLLARALETA